MKVLNKQDWKLAKVCADCKSELEIEAGDIVYYAGSDYPIFRNPVYYCKCGACGQDIDFSEFTKDIPKYVKDMALDAWQKKNRG